MEILNILINYMTFTMIQIPKRIKIEKVEKLVADLL